MSDETINDPVKYLNTRLQVQVDETRRLLAIRDAIALELNATIVRLTAERDELTHTLAILKTRYLSISNN